jgi:hypothetical protein
MGEGNEKTRRDKVGGKIDNANFWLMGATHPHISIPKRKGRTQSIPNTSIYMYVYLTPNSVL